MGRSSCLWNHLYAENILVFYSNGLHHSSQKVLLMFLLVLIGGARRRMLEDRTDKRPGRRRVLNNGVTQTFRGRRSALR